MITHLQALNTVASSPRPFLTSPIEAPSSLTVFHYHGTTSNFGSLVSLDTKMSTLIGEFASTTLADHAFLTDSDLDIQYPSPPSPDSSLVKDDATTPPTSPTTSVVILEAVTTPPHRSPSPPPPSFSVLPPIQLTPVINPEDVPLPDDPDVELEEVVETSSDNAGGEPILLFDILEASVVHDPIHAVTSPSPSPSVYDPTEPLVGQVFVDDSLSLSSSLATELPSDSGDSSLELVLQAETPGSPIAQEAIPAVSSSSANEARLTALDGLRTPEDSPISPQQLPDHEKKAKRSRPHTRNKDRQTRIKNASVPGSEEWHANEDSRRLQRWCVGSFGWSSRSSGFESRTFGIEAKGPFRDSGVV